MKANLHKAGVLALVAALFCAPGGLFGQDAQSKLRNFLGVRGGLSLFDAVPADAVYPGVYPNKPVFGIMFTGYDLKDKPWLAGELDILYLDQLANSDVALRDELGNIIEVIPVECSRQYLEILALSKIRIASKSRVTPVLLVGWGVTFLLNTTRTPDVVDPAQPRFRGAVFNIVLGAGLDVEVGKLLLSLDVRLDNTFDDLDWGRADPLPNAVVLTAGIGWRMGRG